jgi:hypothetical protein
MFSGCKKDFLDVPNKSVILRQAYVTDLKTLGDYLNGTYSELGANYFSSTTGVYSEIISDNIKTLPGMSFLAQHYAWKQVANDEKFVKLGVSGTNINGLWLAAYRIIRDCNFVIEAVGAYRDQDPVAADDLKGQALALRAYLHHQLSGFFAQPYGFSSVGNHPGIPYITASSYLEPISRQTSAQNYEMMIADLREAISLLPPAPKNVDSKYIRSVINKQGAKALLSRVYLFKNDYENALKLALEVCSEVPLMVRPDYPVKLFTLDDKEALFQVTPAGSSSILTTFFSGPYFRSSLRYVATSDVAGLLSSNPNDVRSSWVVKEAIDGTDAYTIRKFPVGVTGQLSSPEADYFQPVIRTSEMFLTASECYAKLGDEDLAREYLDKVRKRADPATAVTNLSGTLLVDAIYRERRIELAFEGGRMENLLRTKQSVLRSDSNDPSATMLSYPSNKAIAPIPLSDVMLNHLKQNDDY